MERYTWTDIKQNGKRTTAFVIIAILVLTFVHFGVWLFQIEHSYNIAALYWKMPLAIYAFWFFVIELGTKIYAILEEKWF